MRHLSAICFSVALSFGLHTAAKAQGSSDPGLSTVGGLRSAPALAFGEDSYENDRLHFSVEHTFAKGERDITLNMPKAEARIPLTQKSYLEAQLPFFAVRGNLARVASVGDLVLAYTYFMPFSDGFTWQFTGGTEIGLGNASQADGKGRALPMAYQSSQGTTDLILGASVQYKDYVSFAVGYQQPLIQYNGNNYTHNDPLNELPYSSSDFPTTNRLYRNGDLMFRLEGHLTSRRVGFSAGPLLFYHLRNDMYVDVINKYRELPGSKGTTLNLTANAFYRLGRYGQWKIDVSGAVPVAERDMYPDGSKRQWLLTPRISYFFGQRALLF